MLQLATEKDWEDVKRLSIQIHDLHVSWRQDMYYHSDEPLPHDVFSELIDEKMVYVAKLSEVIVGYIVVAIVHKGGQGMHPKKMLRIESICVDETLRGHGIGLQIIQDTKALCTAFGCDGLILGVHPENDRAVNFYQKCGFRIRTINMEM